MWLCGYVAIPGHLLWRVGFLEVTGVPYFWCFGKVARWSFPDVRRAPGDRPHSEFSNWFTYKWVARVSLGRRKGEGAQWLLRKVPGKSQAPIDVRVLDASRCSYVAYGYVAKWL